MSYVTGLQCVHCRRTYNTNEVEYFCPACGSHNGILDVVYDYDKIKADLNPSSLAQNADWSMWRYLPLLPVGDRTLIPHLQVGWTPLYDAPRLANELGVARCWVKDEGRNPTASFKDRASAIGVVKALEKKASKIACASTGNAASSLAGFAAAAQCRRRSLFPRTRRPRRWLSCWSSARRYSPCREPTIKHGSFACRPARSSAGTTATAPSIPT